MTIQEPGQFSAAGISDLRSKGFKVYEISKSELPAHTHGRKDHYKIVLVTGDMTVNYGDKSIRINDTYLFFSNPRIAHSVVQHSKEKKGYACIFTETFFAGRERKEILQDSPLFSFGANPVIALDSSQAVFLTALFQKMLSIHSGNYEQKGEMLRKCIELIIHEALNIQPSQNGPQQKNAATRITWLFLELLERQFPIESVADSLRLRTAQDFAIALSVHVNYLNRSVKQVTGKPTSVHIAERIVAEAKALLQHTDWSVADIAYGLGFDYPTYFNNYFKRMTGTIPKAVRANKV